MTFLIVLAPRIAETPYDAVGAICMILMTLWGGLGNQMFQYAAGLALARQANVKLMLDITPLQEGARRHASLAGHTPRSFELDAFQISGQVADKSDVQRYYAGPEASLGQKLLARLYRSVSRMRSYHPPPFAYEERFAVLKAPILAMGSFQHYRYSEPVLEHLRFEFGPRLLNPAAVELIERIRGEKSIGVHVRRGDYVDNPVYSAIGAQSLQYYRTALDIALERAGKAANIYVFSDDIGWVRAMLDLCGNVTYASDPSNGFTSHDEFEIMKHCQHLVLSNSSFSWWAARLKKCQGGAVIAPRIWVKEPQVMSTEFCPPAWLLI